MASIEEFRKCGKEMIDYVADYLKDISERDVLPDVQPGFMESLIPSNAPEDPQSFTEIMKDVENLIMPGMTHWRHPMFNAFYPTANGTPSILADILSTATSSIGFSWIASPAMTELEMIMMDWLAKLINLPECFLFSSKEKGGGVIHGTSSEATLYCVLAARLQYEINYNVNQLVIYASSSAHSCVEKAAVIAGVKCKLVETDKNYSLRGETLAKAIKEDKDLGLVPICVVATLGTTNSCAFDNLEEIGKVCQQQNIWLHVDAAYAGSAFICEEYRYLIKGIEYVDSYTFNPHKCLQVNFDCCALWLKDATRATKPLNTDPQYLRHDNEGKIPDYRHWQIPLGRRFRSLKIWFTLRLYGKSGLQQHVRNYIQCAKDFESFIRSDNDFEVVAPVVLGLVCFRLKGSNELNEKLNSRVNKERKMFMSPGRLGDMYFLRYSVGSGTEAKHVKIGYDILRKHADNLLEK